MYCKVLTASRSPGISDGLTYECDDQLRKGSYVRVPLRNAIVDGMVLDVMKERGDTSFSIKRIHKPVELSPLLTDAQIHAMQWMCDKYLCSLRQALSVWLPPSPWDGLLPKTVRHFRKNFKDTPQVRGSKQQLVLEALEPGPVEESRLREMTGASASTISSLVEKGLILAEETKEFDERMADRRVIEKPALNEAQQRAYEEIGSTNKPSLLYGVTGSGKTEVYASLIADAVERGKQSMVLVPEILLTEHCIDRFRRLLGEDRVAVMHSKMTPAQRKHTWRTVHDGGIDLVIGSRSALFAPLQRLGLIIIDEEHEWTYKNEKTPRYVARDVARALCESAEAKLVLGSATPSLEAWHRAKTGTYAMHELPDRYGDAELPDVEVIDLAEANFGSCYPLTRPLINAINDCLNRGEQSVLFLNRRGVATAVMCKECRRRIVSPDSQLPFTVHKTPAGSSYLADHTTGTVADIPERCPSCSSTELITVGAGTHGLEELIARLFPRARLLRADKDTLKTPEDMRDLLKHMREGSADILLGTQSVVKGLDLPNVTLAAVVLADVGLSLPHFRAGERIFQLLTQLTGRSGRAKPGKVIIQSFRPDAPEIKCAASHATTDYIENELKLRRYTNYPPCTEMIRLIARGPDAKHKAQTMASLLEREKSAHAPDVRIGCSSTLWSNGNIWHVIVRGEGSTRLIKSIDTDGMTVDVDPMECI